MPETEKPALISQLLGRAEWYDNAHPGSVKTPGLLREAASELLRLTGELERAREALKPFAALADDYLADTVNMDDATIMAGRTAPRRGEHGTPPRVTFGDFRKARAALATQPVETDTPLPASKGDDK